MPDLTANTYTKTTSGCGFLAATRWKRKMLFNGNSLGAGVTIYYRDDEGALRTIPDGDVTALPQTKTFDGYVDLEVIVGAGGDLNMTDASGIGRD